MKALSVLLLFLFAQLSFAQTNGLDEVFNDNANQLEDLMQDEESESENDYDIQQLRYFIKHPIDLNGPDLEQLTLLDPLLISNLSAYRNVLGDIIDIHELQAVPGFTITLIKSILPYITIKKEHLTLSNLRESLSKGEHSILIRPMFTPELKDGYKSSSEQQFNGSPTAIFMRYKYNYRNRLQFGFIGDKDAGEKLLVNNFLPDFVSFHLFARRIGIIKSIALGDFTVNLGQGLIHWQSQAFRKSSSVINIKRQSDVLRPYHSAGEYNFLRGLASTLSRGKSEFTLFLSSKKLNANVESGVITSVSTAGLHRTVSELKDRNRVSLISGGFGFRQFINSGHIGFNSVHHIYSLPLLKKNEPYNLYSLKGTSWTNFSADYSYTFRNFHLFGEVATDKRSGKAYINGLMSSLSQFLDLALLHRWINKSYQSVFGNSFTENTMPVNENGFYAGVSLKPYPEWKIDLYADLFSFPWLKYRLNAPAQGVSYLIQISYKPNKQTEIYSRFRYRLKPLNIVSGEDLILPGIQQIQNWRTHLSFQVTKTIMLRTRAELCIFSHQYIDEQKAGYLFYTDLTFKPLNSIIAGNIRFQFFEVENYDTRIYAYENDVEFVTSIPGFYNNGIRCYLNFSAKMKVKFLSNRQLTVNFKAASTVYNNISSIGNGPDLIYGNRVSTGKLQIILTY